MILKYPKDKNIINGFSKSETVVLSGFFNPLHCGHLETIKYAHAFGTVIVIVNNDLQVGIKGSTPFMSEDERLEIVHNIQGVRHVVLSFDTDESVAQTLALINPKLFINGGDRFSPNPKEQAVCKEKNIGMLFAPHLDKIQSSSTLIEDAFNYYYNNLFTKGFSDMRSVKNTNHI